MVNNNIHTLPYYELVYVNKSSTNVCGIHFELGLPIHPCNYLLVLVDDHTGHIVTVYYTLVEYRLGMNTDAAPPARGGKNRKMLLISRTAERI